MGLSWIKVRDLHRFVKHPVDAIQSKWNPIVLCVNFAVNDAALGALAGAVAMTVSWMPPPVAHESSSDRGVGVRPWIRSRQVFLRALYDAQQSSFAQMSCVWRSLKLQVEKLDDIAAGGNVAAEHDPQAGRVQ
eukprot:m.41056 g.41056  ORF g.41056 m.41056 type:complete len:133 (+) comp11778_c0_seq2:152-550(+)